ncbi:Lrp/AsnC family transcriptional regulator [Flectobacillus major]|uniref:Lrp/AsnC family transcriptional regulator n=1 Tax=Flectobacillus major TaxID=103 RepID=UPI0005C4A14A|nr:Lrp/AsnC family transcriptional regulator [Flectobacillus major]
MELDKLYWDILVLLQENARLSFAEIGRQVGLSSPAVAERVQKLEEAGIIKRFSIDLDCEKLGYSLKASILFKAHSGKIQAFLNYIKQMPEIYQCDRITGEYCLVMKLVVKRPNDLENIINQFSEFGDSTTSVILSSPIDSKVMHPYP